MKRPDIVTLVNALIIIALGLWGYFANETRPGTALIAPAFGFVFLASVPMMKKHNKIVSHIVVLLTFLLAIMTGFMLVKGSGGDTTMATRKMIILGGTCISCFIATGLYISNFRYNRKLKEESGQ